MPIGLPQVQCMPAGIPQVQCMSVGLHSGTVYASRPTSGTGQYRLPQVRILGYFRYRSIGYLRYRSVDHLRCKHQAFSGTGTRSKSCSGSLVYLRYRRVGLSVKDSKVLLLKSTSNAGKKVICSYRTEGYPQVQCRVLPQVHCLCRGGFIFLPCNN
jgi:hypothetical protein